MQTHPLGISNAGSQLEGLRAELMLFNDVLDVFSTAPDTVLIVCSGRPRPAEWTSALRAAGYTMPPRRHARSGDPPGAADDPDGGRRTLTLVARLPAPTPRARMPSGRP